MIRVKIDVTKIDRTAIHEGKKGKYIDLTLMDNRDGRDEYGNDGFVIHDLGKERRLAGEKGPILGNWKHLDGAPTAGRDVPASEAVRRAPVPTRDNSATEPDDDGDIPFSPRHVGLPV